MKHCLVNGIAADYVSVMDRGLHYGDGVFETIACMNGSAQFVREHLARMRDGAVRLDIPFPDEALFLQDISTLLSLAGDTGDCVIKLMLTRGAGRRGYRYDRQPAQTRICLRSAWPAHVSRWKQGMRTRFCETPISVNARLAGIKHLNRLDNVLASAELGERYDEGFMSDASGYVIEGTMSNVFVVIDDTVITPDLACCGIQGIIRDKLLQIAAEQGLQSQIRALQQHEILTAEEVFVSNSVMCVCPVTRIGEQNIQPGEITSMLDQTLSRLITHYAQAAE
jgi:4-amino-4-deoxychorismate lyase